MDLDTIILVFSLAIAPYLLYKRYRASTSLTPPTSLELWLVSKSEAFIRIIGGISLLLAISVYYVFWQNGYTGRGIFIWLSLLTVIGFILAFNPGYLLDEASVYHSNQNKWREIKQQYIAELKQNYWQIIFRRALFIIALLLIVFYLVPSF